MNQILSDLQWGKPEIVRGKALVKAEPNQSFWSLWRKDKADIKRLGVFVTKEGAKYVVGRWLPIDVKYSSTRKPAVKKQARLRFPTKLLEYQKAHTLQLVNSILKYGASLDGSDPGVGKTYNALAMTKELNLIPFVVCKKIGINVWKRVAKYMDIKEITVINYEKLKTWKTEYLRHIGKRNNEMEWLLDRKETLMIWDEIHFCKSYKTINSKMLIYAKFQGYKIHMLSATVADNPLHLKAIGFVLGLFPRVQDFWPFVNAHGCYKNRFNGYEFSGNHSILKKIHGYIYPEKGSRLQIADLGDAFPDNQVICESYTMDSAKQIQKIYKEMQNELDTLATQSGLDGESHLTIILRARQRIELLKVPTFVEMAKDLIEEGCAIVIFVNFTESLRTIAEKLKTNCIVYGGQTGKKGEIERQENIDRFQTDKERVIILNLRAGGESISLSDMNGKYRRVSLISPTWSAIELTQVLGRIYRSGTKSKCLQRIVYAAETVEETIANAVSEKLDRIKMLNDGDLTKGLNIEGLRKKKE